jgi:aspartate racemase
VLNNNGIECFVPNDIDKKFINDVIFNELLKQQFLDSSKKRFLEIINDSKKEGVKGVILGCTEIPLLIKPEDLDIPSFDTTAIHAKAAVDFALS